MLLTVLTGAAGGQFGGHAPTCGIHPTKQPAKDSNPLLNSIIECYYITK